MLQLMLLSNQANLWIKKKGPTSVLAFQVSRACTIPPLLQTSFHQESLAWKQTLSSTSNMSLSWSTRQIAWSPSCEADMCFCALEGGPVSFMSSEAEPYVYHALRDGLHVWFSSRPRGLDSPRVASPLGVPNPSSRRLFPELVSFSVTYGDKPFFIAPIGTPASHCALQSKAYLHRNS